MKILTTSFLTCAVKACKSSPLSFPLHYKDAELEQSDIAYNPQFLINILPRLDWDAVTITAAELGFTVPAEKPEPVLAPLSTADTSGSTMEAAVASEDEKTLRELHTLLLETEVKEGKLVCGNCGHEYKIKEGIANFLLPSHLGECALLPNGRRTGMGTGVESYRWTKVSADGYVGSVRKLWLRGKAEAS